MQFPMVRHAAEVGWTPVPPKGALAHRGGQKGLLFRGDAAFAKPELYEYLERGVGW